MNSSSKSRPSKSEGGAALEGLRLVLVVCERVSVCVCVCVRERERERERMRVRRVLLVETLKSQHQ